MRKATITLLLGAALALAGGCTALRGTGTSSTGEKGSKGGKVKHEAVLPQDREKIVQPVANVYTSEELSRGVVKGDWAIETVFGRKAEGEEAPYLKFVPTEKRVYGNDGCNTINAVYLYNPADSTLRFSDLTSTLRLCSKAGITDREICMALDSARYYSWRLDGDSYYLYLYDEGHSRIMEMMHQNFQFLNGTWRVAAIGEDEIDNPDMKLVIDVDEGKVHGNTGCNILNGSLETDMDAANSISFQAIGTTRMACPEPNHEMQLLVALEEAMKARALSAEQVEFLNNEGTRVLLLERTSDK